MNKIKLFKVFVLVKKKTIKNCFRGYCIAWLHLYFQDSARISIKFKIFGYTKYISLFKRNLILTCEHACELGQNWIPPGLCETWNFRIKIVSDVLEACGRLSEPLDYLHVTKINLLFWLPQICLNKKSPTWAH